MPGPGAKSRDTTRGRRAGLFVDRERRRDAEAKGDSEVQRREHRRSDGEICSQKEADETNFIFKLAESAARSIDEGYYRELGDKPKPQAQRSLKAAILASKYVPLIAEIKFTSPAEGKLRSPGDVKGIARAYERGGVAGISVLTEPKHFDGDIEYLPLVKKSVEVPVMMKDIIIDPVQVDAGAEMGADAVLLIAAIFMNRLARASLEDMCVLAHGRGMEVMLEAHTKNEYLFALESGADVIGINNRNLDTLEVSLETSKKLLAWERRTGAPVCRPERTPRDLGERHHVRGRRSRS